MTIVVHSFFFTFANAIKIVVVHSAGHRSMLSNNAWAFLLPNSHHITAAFSKENTAPRVSHYLYRNGKCSRFF